MSYRELSPEAQVRCDQAWLDPEVSLEDFKRRFQLGTAEVGKLRARLGAKGKTFVSDKKRSTGSGQWLARLRA